MQFRKNTYAGTNIVAINEDNWDDWFRYETTYYVIYFDAQGYRNDIGRVKIGQNPYPETKKPSVPSSFTTLGKEFFSVGQSDTYYERLKEIDRKIIGFREIFLNSMRDIAYNEEICETVINYHVTTNSLLRDISRSAVRGQFRRMANGGAKLTSYNFRYISPGDTPMSLEFNVDPNSRIPTNIHVVIGRNGVGKTFLMRSMIYALMGVSGDEYGQFQFDDGYGTMNFANIVYVSFSAFDNISEWYSNERKK